MPGEVTITNGFLFDEGGNEIVTLAKLNKLVSEQTAQVKQGAITSRELADGSITSDKLDTNIAAQLGLEDNSVTTAKIVNLAVDSTKLAASAVTEGKIADAAVTQAKAPTLLKGFASNQRMEIGTSAFTFTGTGGTAVAATVTFTTPFAVAPAVFLTVQADNHKENRAYFTVTVTTTGFTISAVQSSTATRTVTMAWQAIGA